VLVPQNGNVPGIVALMFRHTDAIQVFGIVEPVHVCMIIVRIPRTPEHLAAFY
jgi:hypothetical protein